MSKTKDLNIENYELNDILALFKIGADFGEDDLRAAKKIVLKTHPDKSRLDPEYFLFYSKAYRVLFSIWEFKNKSKGKSNTSKDIKSYKEGQETFFDKQNKKTLDSFLSKEGLKDTKSFNKWFNTQFEKNKMEREDDAGGYGTWLKSNEDIDEEKNIHYSQIGEEWKRRRSSYKQ